MQEGTCRSRIYHPGVDINELGTSDDDEIVLQRKVYAVANGEVMDVRSSWGTIVIKHVYQGTLYYSQYGHVRNVKVVKGDFVDKGTEIADLSDKGTGGAHLHFEIRESNHENPTNSGFFCFDGGELTNRSSTEVEQWYEDPLAFIASHGAYDVDSCDVFTESCDISVYGEPWSDGSVAGWYPAGECENATQWFLVGESYQPIASLPPFGACQCR